MSQPLPYGLVLPPTQDELPSDDGIPMETQRHKLQMDLLIDALYPWLEARDDGYIGGNMFVYYSLAQVRNQDFRGPDFFAVLGVPKGERKSWVVWEEGKTPDVVIELLSESTASFDKNEKKRIYLNQMHVPEYFWFDPFNPNDWAGFTLQSSQYKPIPINEKNQLVSQSLGLALVRWEGNYQGVNATWLRWATLEGNLLLYPQEMADIARVEASLAREEASLAQQRANQAESQLRQVAFNLLQEGMTVEQVMRLTGLSESDLEQ